MRLHRLARASVMCCLSVTLIGCGGFGSADSGFFGRKNRDAGIPSDAQLNNKAAADAQRAALAKASGGIRSLVKLSGSGITLMLSAIPLKHRPGSTCEQIALFFERRGICDSGMFVFFARSHRLTRTEEQVLNLLCRGMSTPDIALELDVAVSTVRSHVRSL